MASHKPLRVGSCRAVSTEYRLAMVAPLLPPQEEQIVLEELLRPEMASHGPQPERRIVVCGIPWKRYLAFDKKLGDDRPGPRMYYLEGELELMTTSHEHERLKKWIADLLAIYFEETGIEIIPRGQATMRLREAGAEPDESWCIGREKEFPDLVLEVALTSGGVNKLELYRRFQVREVWFWRKNKLEIFALGGRGPHEPQRKSALLPDLEVALLERCVGIRSWQQARRTFRAGLTKAKARQ